MGSERDAVSGHVDGLGEKAGRYVRDQLMSLCIGELPELGPVDRVVLADIDVIGIFRNVQVGAVGNIAEGLVLGRRDADSVRILLRFLVSPLGPLTRHDISRLAVLRKIHRNSGELLMGAALQEQDFVVVRDPHDLAQIRFRLFDDPVIDLAPVAHLHDGHSASAVIEHFFLCFF